MESPFFFVYQLLMDVAQDFKDWNFLLRSKFGFLTNLFTYSLTNTMSLDLPDCFCNYLCYLAMHGFGQNERFKYVHNDVVMLEAQFLFCCIGGQDHCQHISDVAIVVSESRFANRLFQTNTNTSASVHSFED